MAWNTKEKISRWTYEMDYDWLPSYTKEKISRFEFAQLIQKHEDEIFYRVNRVFEQFIDESI
tara:strand:- start:377 stop:562 length:186 start_codon:yes stop_codon:yes gene_type:complete